MRLFFCLEIRRLQHCQSQIQRQKKGISYNSYIIFSYRRAAFIYNFSLHHTFIHFLNRRLNTLYIMQRTSLFSFLIFLYIFLCCWSFSLWRPRQYNRPPYTYIYRKETTMLLVYIRDVYNSCWSKRKKKKKKEWDLATLVTHIAFVLFRVFILNRRGWALLNGWWIDTLIYVCVYKFALCSLLLLCIQFLTCRDRRAITAEGRTQTPKKNGRI